MYRSLCGAMVGFVLSSGHSHMQARSRSRRSKCALLFSAYSQYNEYSEKAERLQRQGRSTNDHLVWKRSESFKSEYRAFDSRQQSAGVAACTVVIPKPSEAICCAHLPRSGAAASGEIERLTHTGLDFLKSVCTTHPEQQFSSQTIQSGSGSLSGGSEIGFCGDTTPSSPSCRTNVRLRKLTKRRCEPSIGAT